MAVSNSYRDAMKKAAGLTASYFDAEVVDLVEQARAEMARSGVQSFLTVSETDPLIKGAIKTFVQANKAESAAESEKLMDSFRLQVESMAKSTCYRGDL